MADKNVRASDMQSLHDAWRKGKDAPKIAALHSVKNWRHCAACIRLLRKNGTTVDGKKV